MKSEGKVLAEGNATGAGMKMKVFGGASLSDMVLLTVPLFSNTTC
jgi:hypothetical protein